MHLVEFRGQSGVKRKSNIFRVGACGRSPQMATNGFISSFCGFSSPAHIDRVAPNKHVRFQSPPCYFLLLFPSFHLSRLIRNPAILHACLYACCKTYHLGKLVKAIAPLGAGKMAQALKVFATKPENPSWIPGTHALPKVSFHLHTCAEACMCVPINTCDKQPINHSS